MWCRVLVLCCWFYSINPTGSFPLNLLKKVFDVVLCVGTVLLDLLLVEDQHEFFSFFFFWHQLTPQKVYLNLFKKFLIMLT